MLITGIKSRPIYDRLSVIARAKHHIVASQGTGGQAALRLLNEMGSAVPKVDVIYSRQSFSGNDLSAEIEKAGVGSRSYFNSNSELIDDLAARLSTANVGTVLYLAGSETFIGSAMQVAARHDLKRDEILREHCGTLARRVVCIHCNAFKDDVTRRLFRCEACGEMLVVRDHYSSRLAAFMGVKADAEEPGTLPADEELDT